MNARIPSVSLVVAPRERFSFARKSLESIYEHTTTPFRLIYVDGGSPRHVQRYLQTQSRTRDFELIRTDHYLSPNRARNLGLAKVQTDYVVFIDNDVVVSLGWLESLIACAEKTGAWVVSPLICQHKPLHEQVHCAGGKSGVAVRNDNGVEARHIVEKIFHQGRKVTDLQAELRQQKTGLAEFHCMLVHMRAFKQLGPLDEKLLNTKEHVDFCIMVEQAGGDVYLEPQSVVTYVPGPPLEWSDLAFYMLRWSNAWELASLKRLREKWNLTEDDYFRNRIRNVGWRRRMTIVRPLSQTLTFDRGSKKLEKALTAMDQRLNRRLTDRYSQRNQAGLSG